MSRSEKCIKFCCLLASSRSRTDFAEKKEANSSTERDDWHIAELTVGMRPIQWERRVLPMEAFDDSALAYLKIKREKGNVSCLHFD